MIFEFDITPMGKPRMTRADAWKKRPCVEKYWAFKKSLTKQVFNKGYKIATAFDHYRFVIPMPSSWSKKKRAQYLNVPHQQKPDIDNLIKSFFDALTKDDSKIWHVSMDKIWGSEGRIIVTRP